MTNRDESSVASLIFAEHVRAQGAIWDSGGLAIQHCKRIRAFARTVDATGSYRCDPLVHLDNGVILDVYCTGIGSGGPDDTLGGLVSLINGNMHFMIAESPEFRGTPPATYMAAEPATSRPIVEAAALAVPAPTASILRVGIAKGAPKGNTDQPARAPDDDVETVVSYCSAAIVSASMGMDAIVMNTAPNPHDELLRVGNKIIQSFGTRRGAEKIYTTSSAKNASDEQITIAFPSD